MRTPAQPQDTQTHTLSFTLVAIHTPATQVNQQKLDRSIMLINK